jgi:RHS repeat-associated protein
MLPAAEERIPALASGEEIFSLAAGVAVAALETHQGANAAQGKKPHQGIFSRNRTIAVGATWAKWPETHQDSETWWRKTVVGSALDANGNTLSDAQGRTFTWDFENRLTQVVNPGVGTTTFRYDPFGRRIQKSGLLGTTNYLHDGDNLIEEMDGNASILARYTQGPGIDQPFAELRSGTNSYYQQDGLGSVSSLSNLAGSLANTYSYDSFGKLTSSTGTVTNPTQYAAREFDSETGLYYYRARYYDPTGGRFLAEDPLGFAAGPDFYSYVENDPTNLRDPMGLSSAPAPAPTPQPPAPGPEPGPPTTGPGWGPVGFCAANPAVCILIIYLGSPGGGGDWANSNEAAYESGARSIPKPDCPKRGCTCTCRADADDTMPGNIKPGLPRFAFGTATASNCSDASKDAKRIATQALGMKPKHIGCRCSEK